MARKSKQIISEFNELLEKVKETEQLLKLSEKEELDLLESVRTNINQIAESNNLFCGIILTPDDITNIIKMAISAKDNIKIPFQLYYNE
jgi:hypothetical protein